MVLKLALQKLVSRPQLSKPQLACATDNFVEQHPTRLAAVKPYGLRRLIDLNQYLGHDHHYSNGFTHGCSALRQSNCQLA